MFNNSTVIGGAANALFNLAREQSKSNNVSIVGQMPGDALKTTFIESENSKIELVPINVHSSPNSLQFGIEYSTRILYYSIKNERNPAIVHGHSGYFDYIIPTITYSRVKNSAAIQTVYCPVFSKGGLSRYVGKWYFLSLASYQIKKFIAISNNISKSLQLFGVNPERIVIIPPAIDIQRYTTKHTKSEIRNHLGLPVNCPIILFVGSTIPVKNLETVIKALPLVIQEIPSVKLIITTELQHKNHRARSTYLLSLIMQLGIKEHIIKKGIVNNMSDLMTAADVLVAPFLNTYGPSDYFIAALEAMSIGRPVVVSAVGGMPEIINPEVGVLTSPQDVEGIAMALIKLLLDADHSAAMGFAASKKVREKFHPTIIADKVQSVYDEALK